jgi:hypothetical protein
MMQYMFFMTTDMVFRLEMEQDYWSGVKGFEVNDSTYF